MRSTALLLVSRLDSNESLEKLFKPIVKLERVPALHLLVVYPDPILQEYSPILRALAQPPLLQPWIVLSLAPDVQSPPYF
jgi:hypothetical protein